MAEQNNGSQLNLTVVALVALVAIVGLVALVMNAASAKTTLATGAKLASADTQTTTTAAAENNVAGNAPAGNCYREKVGTRWTWVCENSY